MNKYENVKYYIWTQVCQKVDNQILRQVEFQVADRIRSRFWFQSRDQGWNVSTLVRNQLAEEIVTQK